MGDFAASHGVTPVVIPQMSREVALGDAMTIYRLWRLMVTYRPDIVHTHTSKAGAVGRVAGLLYRFATPRTMLGRPRSCRFVHTYHGHIFHSYYGEWKTHMYLAVDRLLARVTDRIVVLGPQQLDELRDRFHLADPSKFAVVPLGIDRSMLRSPADARARLRSRLGIDEGERAVGIVARLTAIKNHELFLRVAQAFPESARFVVFGDGPRRRDVEQRAIEMNLGARVIFAGVQSADEMYAAVDIVALTSRNEGTPLTLIEAMLSGRPVISTAVGGVVDLLGRIEERVTAGGSSYEIRERGIGVRSDDVEGFIAGLSRLLSDAPLRSALAARAKEYAERSHGAERLVADITRLYGELTPQSH